MDARDAQIAMLVARIHIVTQITMAIVSGHAAQGNNGAACDVYGNVGLAGKYADEILRQNPFPA